VLLVVTLLAVTLITLDARGVSVLGQARSGATEATGPIQRAGRWLTSPFRSVWHGITDYENLKAKNEQLRDRLAAAQGERVREANAQEQLERLNEQLDIGFTGKLRSQVARVTTGPYSNFRSFTVTIDRGSDRGIRKGMPVVTKAGLVGRIGRVSATRSEVQLATDPAFVLGIRLASSQDLGVGHGGGEANRFIVSQGINLEDPVKNGEPVLTSGLSGAIMPPDIPIGIVSKVTPDDANRVQQLLVKYSADFTQLDVVQVLKWTPPR